MRFAADWEAVEATTPVLVGVGQQVDRNRDGSGDSPIALIAKAGAEALADCRARDRLSPDAVIMVRLVSDTPVVLDNPADTYRTQYRNPPGALAEQLGLAAARTLYNEGGGASPQRSLNEAAAMIAGGEVRSVLLAGGEALATQTARRRAGKQKWEDQEGSGEPELSGELKPMATGNEIAHGLAFPINTYPLFANALRKRYGQSVQQHLEACAELFSPLSEVAAKNPLSWFPKAHSVEDIATVGEQNRWVGLPYPKYLNAVMRVNMSAAVVLCSWAEADRLGIARDRRIFLHGCSQANDSLEITARPDFSDSPAIRFSTSQALQMAGIGAEDLNFMDIYSCFPSAVQVGCDAIGIDHGDKRGLTLTGGLPYFGGPGNNYAMHAIAEAVQRLRLSPEQFGLVTANGGYLTKHACGIYSGRPVTGPWKSPDYGAVQSAVDAVPAPCPAPNFSGPVRVETYTVVCGRAGPETAIVMGLSEDNLRTVAVVPAENQKLIGKMMQEEWLDRPGSIERQGSQSVFSAAV